VSKVRFTHRAREDLLDIWLYIAPRNSAAAAADAPLIPALIDLMG
jgi:plasmid stabilization system protein ParE